MSTAYPHGRRAPNVSQYLAHLNAAPGQQDMPQDDFSLGDDLDFLTNTEFFDFDNFQGPVPDFAQQAMPGQQKPNVAVPQYQFGEFQTYPPNLTTSPIADSTSPIPGLQGQYPPQPQHAAAQFSASTDGERNGSIAALSSSTADLEESARFAAEEDKRRRNTAASARFRVKKKQREVALEKQAKEMTDKVQHLESKVQQLEQENKWLKGLITEKGEARAVDPSSASTTSNNALSEKKVDADAQGRSTGSRNDGVGTAGAEEA